MKGTWWAFDPETEFRHELEVFGNEVEELAAPAAAEFFIALTGAKVTRPTKRYMADLSLLCAGSLHCIGRGGIPR